MSSFIKYKSLSKISILFLVSISIFLILFLKENVNFENFKKTENKDFVYKKIFNNYDNFFEIKKITLEGRSKSNLNSIKGLVTTNLNKTKNIINFDTVGIKASLEDLNWIDLVSIRKIYPNHLAIRIEEHKEFAIFNKKNENFLISDKGKIIHEINNPDVYELVQLEGEFSLENIYKAKNFLVENNEISNHISKITILPDNRFNVVVDNILFKLPNKNIKEALLKINKFKDIKNLEMVDLRFFEKKIFIKTNSEQIALKGKK